MDPRDPQRVTISELARAIGSAREPTALYAAISEAAVRLLGATVARLWVNDPASGLLRAAGSFGVHRDLEAALLDAVEVPLGTGIPGRIAVARVPEFIPDAHHDPRWLNARFIHALDLQHITRLEMFEHTAPGLPPMLDIWRSSRD